MLFRKSCVKELSKGIKTRMLSSAPIVTELKGLIQELATEKTPIYKELKSSYGNKKIGDVTVDMAMGGMRGIKGMVTETSDLDPVTGIHYRDMNLYDVNKALPKAPGGEAGLPEASLWLLLTGKVPTQAQVDALNAELHARASVPQEVLSVLDNLPHKTMHPMTQLSVGILALQPYSKFNQSYRSGSMRKNEYWEYTLEDSLSMVAQIPQVAARIFRNTFMPGQGHVASRPDLDWAGNYAHMLGINDAEAFKEVTRLYLMLHADHEGGNVSAHATHLVGSALSDPYYSWSAGINGLAGPLHGLANQECLKWLEATHEALGGKEPTVELITQYAKDTLAKGQVIPGYGHAVLRNTDPRFMLEKEFAQKHMADDPLVRLVGVCYEAIPPVLLATGKVKNPYPNVDAHSGVCMKYYGLHQADYYTVVFAVSRTLGVVSQLVWSRVMGMPIERPKSVTLDWLHKAAKAA